MVSQLTALPYRLKFITLHCIAFATLVIIDIPRSLDNGNATLNMWLRVLEVWAPLLGMRIAVLSLTDRISSGLVNSSSTSANPPSNYHSKVESYLSISQLLSSPTFHRAVRRVHKKVHEFRHGKDPSEMGGTNIDSWSPPIVNPSTD